jgi:hypothetical protein
MPTARRHPLVGFLAGLGPLRVLLALVALLFVFLVPAPGARVVYEGFGVVPTLVVPTLAPLVLVVLLLDTLMSFVFANAGSGKERLQLQRTAMLEIALAAILVAAWYPFFRALFPP